MSHMKDNANPLTHRARMMGMDKRYLIPTGCDDFSVKLSKVGEVGEEAEEL